MDIKKLVFLMVICGTITACGGGSDGGGQTSKSIFSEWTRTADNFKYDFRGLAFDQVFDVIIPYAANAGVQYDVTITGTDAAGSIYFANCQHYGPTNYCWPGTTQFNYTNTNGQLTICDGWGNNCEVFR